MERKKKKKKANASSATLLLDYQCTYFFFHFIFHFHICSFSFSRTLFLLSCITQLLLRYAYLSNEHRTKSEIKIKIILFAIMISSFSVCLLTSITFHFLAHWHNIHIHLLRSSRARWSGKKFRFLFIFNKFRMKSVPTKIEREIVGLFRSGGSIDSRKPRLLFFFLWINNILLTMDICTIAPLHQRTTAPGTDLLQPILSLFDHFIYSTIAN